MGDWKNTEWRERLKNKPIRYWIRDEIEEIIKEENIDRSRFYEASKTEYENIIRKFYYSFADYENYPKINISYDTIHFQNRLSCSEHIHCKDWNSYIQNIKSLIDIEQHALQFYVIINDAWVYEGYLPEILSVLSEVDGLLENFYIVSKQYDWLIAHSDDGECMTKFYDEKG